MNMRLSYISTITGEHVLSQPITVNNLGAHIDCWLNQLLSNSAAFPAAHPYGVTIVLGQEQPV